MADDLVSIDHYNSAIAFNWVQQSSTPAPGEATAAGDTLFSQLVAAASTLQAEHAGDVVDLHLIGHSRGAVVVSRALQDLAGQHPAALAGAYVKVTLLDPHPSSPASDALASIQSSPLGKVVGVAYRSFESATNDPPVVLPANAGIQSVEIYYEHTPSSDFPSNNGESVINLWGEGPDDPALINQSGVAIDWHDLTSVDDPTLGLIGHSETHEYYQLYVVDTGTTLLPTASLGAVAASNTVGQPFLAVRANPAPIAAPTMAGVQTSNSSLDSKSSDASGADIRVVATDAALK